MACVSQPAGRCQEPGSGNPKRLGNVRWRSKRHMTSLDTPYGSYGSCGSTICFPVSQFVDGITLQWRYWWSVVPQFPRLGTCHHLHWTAPAILNPWMDTGEKRMVGGSFRFIVSDKAKPSPKIQRYRDEMWCSINSELLGIEFSII